MDGKLNLWEEEKFANCRLCDHPVSSFRPTCKNCGLEMSSEGILELVEIEEFEIEQKDLELTEIYGLRPAAIGGLILSLMGSFCYALGFLLIFKILFGASLLIYLCSFVSWHLNFAKIEFSVEEKEELNKEKSTSISLFLISTAVAVISYLFL